MADRKAEIPDGSTWQHMELLREKVERLTRTLRETEDQFIAECAREWDAGKLTPHDLLLRYRSVQANDIKGFPKRWQAALPGMTRVHMQHLTTIRYDPNGEGGTWHGGWPVPAKGPIPRTGQPVVYLLFDREGVVAYVGSTAMFSKRMRYHVKDGKSIGRWQAYPCATRIEAYDMEQRFLDRHKPYLNRSDYAVGLRPEEEGLWPAA